MERVKQIRVLQLPDTIRKNNGRMHVIMNIYRQIDRSKVQFDFACTKDGGANFENEINELGGRVYFLDNNKKMDILAVYAFVKELLASGRYAAIHYHATSPWGVGLRAAKHLGVPTIIMHSHNSMWGSTKIKAIRNHLFSSGLAGEPTIRVACSQKAGAAIFGKKKYSVLNNAIDTAKYKFDEKKRNTVRKKLNLDAKTLLLGQVGRLAREKNQIFSLNLLKALLVKRSDTRLIFLGEGPMLQKLKELATELGLFEKIIFAGQRSDLEMYYDAMDIFLLPSLYEGLPVAAIEAQCSGLPTLISDRVTTETNVGLADFLSLNRTDEWVERITFLASQQSKRSVGEKLVTAGGYAAVVEAKKWEQLYLQKSF
ncbi:glycosyltransferase [Liquorilactobacillus satsumensis]|nr:glycosyltransferase [Liquorilactobacillus satsumensis]MCP9328136.1 glycosyltransferase [Liquorilactobacillus satsumensis]